MPFKLTCSRYVHEDSAKPWIVPPAKHKEEEKVPDASAPPDNTGDGASDEDEEDAMVSKAAGHGWKGKKKAAPVLPRGEAAPAEVCQCCVVLGSYLMCQCDLCLDVRCAEGERARIVLLCGERGADRHC